jgi:branched-chain amino acid transport system ATP-binding protein
VSTSALESVAGEAPAAALLRVASLSAFYGELRAIHDVELEIAAGDVLAIIGANGAGKSTLLRSIAGLTANGGATRLVGEIVFAGHPLQQAEPHEIVERGVALVPEGRRLFARLSVEDNLLCGAYLPRCRAGARGKLDEVYALFPRLRERRRQVVSQMSGGEQQMVAIGRALMSSPRLLLLDELSLGLSPAMVEEIYRNLARIVATGLSIILVEQDLKRALGACNRFVVMLEGRIVLRGRPGETDEEAITAAYFGARAPIASGAAP